MRNTSVMFVLKRRMRILVASCKYNWECQREKRRDGEIINILLFGGGTRFRKEPKKASYLGTLSNGTTEFNERPLGSVQGR